MASLNKVLLIGNLTRDPQVRYTPRGTAVAEIGLAVNDSWFDKQSNTRKETTTFVDITLWGRDAEVAGEYLAKGRSICIEGRLQLDSWDDKETGQKRSKLRVVCERMQMLGGRGEGGGGGGAARGGNAPAARSGGGEGESRGNSGGGGEGEFRGGGNDFGGGSGSSGAPADFPDDEVPF